VVSLGLRVWVRAIPGISIAHTRLSDALRV
jgi:hypothetical protein